MTDIKPPSPLSVPSHDDETFMSLVSRIAVRNGAADLSDFRKDIGVRQEDMLRADPEALAELALGAGIHDHPSLRRTPVAFDGGRFAYGKAILTSRDLARFRVRICQKCINGDRRRDSVLGPYQRFEWLLADVHTCHEHNCLLIDVTDTVGSCGRLDFHFAIQNADLRAFSRLGDRVTPQHRGLENYLIGRVRGARTSAFLDGMEYRVIAATSTALGCLIQSGPKAKLDDLSERELRSAGHYGFQILSEGPASFRGALERIRMSKPVAAAKHRKRFGGFFDWLRNKEDPAFNPIKDIVREYILDTFPVPEGMEVLGVECGEQRRHTLATGARMIDMNRARLGHRLVERGLASVKPGRPIPVLLDYIPVDVLEQIKKDEATDYDLDEVCELFGVHRNIAGRLARAGFLGTRSFEDTGTYRFERDDVWKLKHRLFGTVAMRSLGTDTHLPLFDAARQFRLPIEALIHYCCNETLKLKHPPSSRRLLTDLLVPIDELKRHIEPKRSEGLLHKDAAKTLHVDRKTISELVAAGKLVEKSIHIPYADHSIRYITVESLRAFCADYFSLANLALSVDREPGPYAQYLAARGIRPCVDIASSSRIYKRSDFRRKKD